MSSEQEPIQVTDDQDADYQGDAGAEEAQISEDTVSKGEPLFSSQPHFILIEVITFAAEASELDQSNIIEGGRKNKGGDAYQQERAVRRRLVVVCTPSCSSSSTFSADRCRRRQRYECGRADLDSYDLLQCWTCNERLESDATPAMLPKIRSAHFWSRVRGGVVWAPNLACTAAAPASTCIKHL